MNSFAVTLPMPPSVNQMFATDFKTKRRFSTADYRKWRARVKDHILDSWKAQGSPSFDRHLQLTIHIGLNYQSDISNRLKAIEDALCEAIPGFPNDRYIDRIEIERVQDVRGARVLVTQHIQADAA